MVEREDAALWLVLVLEPDEDVGRRAESLSAGADARDDDDADIAAFDDVEEGGARSRLSPDAFGSRSGAELARDDDFLTLSRGSLGTLLDAGFAREDAEGARVAFISRAADDLSDVDAAAFTIW